MSCKFSVHFMHIILVMLSLTSIYWLDMEHIPEEAIVVKILLTPTEGRFHLHGYFVNISSKKTNLWLQFIFGLKSTVWSWLLFLTHQGDEIDYVHYLWVCLLYAHYTFNLYHHMYYHKHTISCKHCHTIILYARDITNLTYKKRKIQPIYLYQL